MVKALVATLEANISNDILIFLTKLFLSSTSVHVVAPIDDTLDKDIPSDHLFLSAEEKNTATGTGWRKNHTLMIS